MTLKRKKGSTLILVIITVGVLTIVGTSVAVMTLADRKMRIQESNNTKNLYSSEAGIDIAYGVLSTVVQQAITSGNKQVDIDKENTSDKQRLKYNEIFQNEYKKYLKENLENKINSGKYEVKLADGETEKPDVIGTVTEDTNGFNVKLESTFTPTKNNNKVTKKISVSYKIKIPDYGKTPQYNMLKNIFTCDGTLTINNNGSLELCGNIWVEGKVKLGNNIDPIYEKYKGGVNIKGIGKTGIYGEVVTASTFSVNSPKLTNSSSGVKLDGKVYASNFYVGKENSGDTVEGIEVNGENAAIYVNNDLAINSLRTNVTLNDFYGLNDIRKSYAQSLSNYRTSSAIIINSTDVGNTDGTKLTVNKNAYIMGTAYINTTPEAYQTGESVAIKGNYKAYTEQLDDSKYKDAIFEYKSPLQVITKLDSQTEMNVGHKAEYFDLYNTKNNGKLNNKGIALNKSGNGSVESIGAYYTEQGEVRPGKYNIEVEDKLKPLREEFASKVFMMGSVADVAKFEEGKVKSNVDSQIDWEKMKTVIAENRDIVNENIILNNDENKPINVSITKNNKLEISIGDTVVKTYDNNNPFFIITKGDVVYNLDGRMSQIKGSVIAKGNITINMENSINVADSTVVGNAAKTGNEDVTKDIINLFNKQYSSIFEKIFKRDSATGYEIENIVPVKEYIKQERWKLEK